MSLKTYNKKRNFSQTTEPRGKKVKTKGPLRFVVQMHAASRLHFDFRLEIDGALKSWAVPKGPSLNPQEQRLAIYVEDHPLEYGSFEGIIPKGNYGAGTVMLWDNGTYIERGSKGREDSEKALKAGLEKGHITFILTGQKLRGEFALVRLKKGDEKSWLLIKKRDEFSSREDILDQNLSVKTGRTLKQISGEAESSGDVWFSRQNKPIPTKKPVSKPRRPHDTTSLESAKDPSTSKMPRRIKPMLAHEEQEPFNQKGWVFEKNEKGIRVIIEIENGVANLYSKQLLKLNSKFPDLVKFLCKIKHQAVLDGEISTRNKKPNIHIFDLLYLDGKDYRESALLKRKQTLSELKIFNDVICYCDHENTNGVKTYEQAQKEEYPALLAKDAQSTYRSGVSRYWITIPIKEKSKNNLKISSEKNEEPKLTNLNKIFFPKEGYTKGDVIEYYRKIAPIILPHLIDRPQSLNRHPNGIKGKSFFQKDVIGHLPRFLKTHSIFSESVEKSINYVLCQNEPSLLYLANLGCIELNPWLSRITNLENPDYLVIDLDPDGNKFEQVVEVSLEVRRVLESIGAISFCKTSGSSGMHICVPTAGRYNYDVVRLFAEKVCSLVHKKLFRFTSVDRNPTKRRGKIYLDFMQNRRGQTLAAPYCIRPRDGATVSTPLSWSEVIPSLSPKMFTMNNIFQRLDKVGDLWRPLLASSVDLKNCTLELEKLLK